jgi:hypothetical protein
MVVRILTYDSETLSITRKQEAKIETAEIKFLRRVAGCIWKDQIRNIKIMEG